MGHIALDYVPHSMVTSGTHPVIRFVLVVNFDQIIPDELRCIFGIDESS
jgi:hypothetical protein